MTDLEMQAAARAIIRSRASTIDVAAFLAEFFEQVGGYKRFVADFVQQYQLAKPGTLPKFRQMEFLGKLILYETQRKQTNPTPVGQLEDEDLHLIVRQHVERMVDGPNGSAAAAAVAVEPKATPGQG
jgi:hypothetical protein